MTVRRALSTDRTAVLRLLKSSWSGAGLDRPDGVGGFSFEYDAAYADRLFNVCALSPSGLCLVYCVDDVPRGVLMASAVDYDLGPIKIGVERIFWIDPEYRGRAAIKMLNLFEVWAKEQGCMFTDAAGKRDPRFEMMLSRRGYQSVETHYLKRL